MIKSASFKAFIASLDKEGIFEILVDYFFLVSLPAAIFSLIFAFFFACPLRRSIFTALLLRPKPITYPF